MGWNCGINLKMWYNKLKCDPNIIHEHGPNFKKLLLLIYFLSLCAYFFKNEKIRKIKVKLKRKINIFRKKEEKIIKYIKILVLIIMYTN